MRRTLTAACLAAALASSAPALAGGLAVPLDGGVRLHLRGAAADVIVANPAVADVTVVDDRTLIVLGRRHGTTGVVVLDAARRVLWEGPVTVTAPAGQITVTRGSSQEQYACVSRCERVAAAAPAAGTP